MAPLPFHFSHTIELHSAQVESPYSETIGPYYEKTGKVKSSSEQDFFFVATLRYLIHVS